eukprot:c5402_g1_i1.p1 GENE.c5402_g1_i1~~c5402_g1_i1.p1  ORF type:complete len:171 (-),score=42.09 c5402_g1_i1:86-598(-)
MAQSPQNSNPRSTHKGQAADTLRISDEKLKYLRSSFEMLDQDRSGQITIEELFQTAKAMGFDSSEVEVRDLINELDKDHSGTVDMEEFLNVVIKRETRDPTNDIQDAFRALDTDANGFISNSELRTTFASFGEHLSIDEVDAIIGVASDDATGILTFEKFDALMRRDVHE